MAPHISAYGVASAPGRVRIELSRRTYPIAINDGGKEHPEEIRKANLCGADIRGAKIDNVDFYLVDLRDARFDADQEKHFRRCGAILEWQT